MKFLYFPFFLLLCSCAQRTETTLFQIKTLESTNQNNPFYVLFKATDLPHFLTDDYQRIAHQRMLSEDHPDYLDSAFFIPGETKTISIPNPENKSIGVYFIFTRPGEEWKYIASESDKKKIKILVGEDEIKAVNSF